jgi:hypothetical protein
VVTVILTGVVVATVDPGLPERVNDVVRPVRVMAVPTDTFAVVLLPGVETPDAAWATPPSVPRSRAIVAAPTRPLMCPRFVLLILDIRTLAPVGLLTRSV